MRPDKVGKNYYRDELMLLAKYYEENPSADPVIFTGKYKHAASRFATFITIRPFSTGRKYRTICQHVNIPRVDVLRYLDLGEAESGRKYYLLARAGRYRHYGDFRGKLALADDEPTAPICVMHPDAPSPSWIRAYPVPGWLGSELRPSAALEP